MSTLQLSRLFLPDTGSVVPSGSPVSCVDISVLVRKCSEFGVRTAADLLRLTELQVSSLIDISVEDAKALIAAVSCRICPMPKTALDLLVKHRSSVHALPTELASLDSALHGGVPAGSITELVGRSGNGKTQMCITLAVKACVSTFIRDSDAGFGCVVYFDTENKFNSTRLVEIACARFPEIFGGAVDSAEAADRLRMLLEAVIVYREPSSQTLLQALKDLDDVIVTRSVSLIVLDSIASLVRKEFGRDDLVARQEILSETASVLKMLAETYSVPVVVTNQILGKLRDDTALAMKRADSVDVVDADSNVVPALGNTWSHCVNTRIMMDTAAPDTAVRSARIVKSPIAPAVACFYVITDAGVRGCESVL